MIKTIFIKEFLLLKNIEISFNNDNIISGESGSGKSIITKAIAYLFCVYDISIADVTGEVVIDNIAYRLHRINNKYFIDDLQVNKARYIALVRNRAELIDQNYNSIILNNKNHINIIDSFIDESIKNDLKLAYNMLIKVSKKVKELENYIYNFDYDYIKFQLDELKAINLNCDEYNLLNKRYTNLKKELEYNEKYSECCRTLNDSNSLFVIEDVINRLIKIDDSFNKYANIYELSNDINKCYIDISSDDLLVKDKLDDVNYLINKYQKDCNELLQYKDKLIVDLEYYHESRSMLTDELETLSVYKKKYDMLAINIHNKRVDTIKRIEVEFNILIKKLGMDECKIRIDINNAENIRNNGTDIVNILIDINGKKEYKSIANKISGGEISRVIFVLTSILIQHNDTELLILDEIDTGLSGQNAIQLAKQFRNICEDKQLICISHSPIVCCFSNNHYFVSKAIDEVIVKKLNNKELLERIAFLSNINVNKETIINAENIIKIIQEFPS